MNLYVIESAKDGETDLNKAKEQEKIIEEHEEEYQLNVSLMYECVMLFHKIEVTK